VGLFGAEIISNGARVLTHCNAVALATAGHGTALGVFRSTVEAGEKISVFADQTRQFFQGARLNAWEMVQENIPVTLIIYNMTGHLMSTGHIDAVVVGFDKLEFALLWHKVILDCFSCLIVHDIQFRFVPLADQVVKVLGICC
jgi:methylthioribose-1-phosphate isomerase